MTLADLVQVCPGCGEPSTLAARCAECSPEIGIMILPYERLQAARYTGWGRDKRLEYGGLWHFVPAVPRKAALCGLIPSFWTTEIRDSIVGDELITVDPCTACVEIAKEKAGFA